MKLLTKTTIYFFTAMVALLGFTGYYLFSQFSRQLDARNDKELLNDEAAWIDYLGSQAEQGTTFVLHSKEVTIFPTVSPPQSYPVIADADDYVQVSGSKVPYRQLSQVVVIGPVTYQLVIKKSQEQKLVLIANFARIMLLVFGVLFLATVIFNWVISQGLWKPFRESLQRLRSADLQRMQDLHFDDTGTTEFNELNATLNYMSSKIYRDFQSMKEFTENAAHEMQTPIAVVQSKLEMLLQESNLRNDQVESVVQASDALTRLARLNQGLLFLAKIENNQFKPTGYINLADVGAKYLVQFSELIKEKQLQVQNNLDAPFSVLLHPSLADSLVSNLLGNAIKYNYPGGALEIKTTAEYFEIANTSKLGEIPKDKLFMRFNASGEKDSSGLGLPIVKQIAETNNLVIRYDMENGLHRFRLSKK